MKLRSFTSMLFGVLCLGLTMTATAAGDPAAGKVKSIPCLGCHGIPGYFNVYPTFRVPRLGGQHPEYIIYALQSYKSGQRSHKTMRAQAASLSDQDMADIAAYLAESGK